MEYAASVPGRVAGPHCCELEMSRRIQPEHESKHENILRAASLIFAEKGFHAARVEEIAEKAGVAKGTVYLYYPSKEALFMAVVEAIMAQWVTRLGEAMAGGRTVADRLRSLLEADFILVNQHAALISLVGQEFEIWTLRSRFCQADQERIQAQAMGLNTSVRLALEQGVAAGELRPGLDMVTAVDLILGTMQVYRVKRMNQQGDLPARELAEKIVEFLIQGLGA